MKMSLKPVVWFPRDLLSQVYSVLEEKETGKNTCAMWLQMISVLISTQVHCIYDYFDFDITRSKFPFEHLSIDYT